MRAITVTNIHVTVETWHGEEVVILRWDVNKRTHRVPLLAKNGKRWTPVRTVSNAQQEFVSAMIGHKATQAETKAYYSDPLNQKLIAALEGK